VYVALEVYAWNTDPGSRTGWNKQTRRKEELISANSRAACRSVSVLPRPDAVVGVASEKGYESDFFTYGASPTLALPANCCASVSCVSAFSTVREDGDLSKMHERANETKYKLCNIVRTGPDDCDRSHKKRTVSRSSK
jgi:hypothetical protein